VTESRLNLGEVIASAGRQLREDFRELQVSNPHFGERGSEAEDILKKFLKGRLPRRFDVGSGLVIGADGTVSRQSDVIVYDAMNSPVYRTGTRLQILPRDNVAAVIEVKSKLNKDELRDAAEKIAAVKKIKATPICGVDQPVTFSEIITTSILGCVFAFDSYTSMETLAENLDEINASQDDPDCWIDLVIVLDKGSIGYALQTIFGEFIGWLAGSDAGNCPIPPLYVHVAQSEVGEKALNHFFVRLISHLTFFRKISAVDLETLFRATAGPIQVIRGYQYTLKGKLVVAEARHQAGSFENPNVRFNLYSTETRGFVGQMCLLPWQDGFVITFSTRFDPRKLFAQLLARFKLRGQLVQCKYGNAIVWTSSVLPLSEEQFIKAAQEINPDLVSVRDPDDDKPPPSTI
jgi:hypothetical protein